MADLVTHLCVGWLPCLALAPRWSLAVAFGTVLPDLSGRVPQMLLVRVRVPIPDRVLWMVDVAHTPFAQACLVVLLGAAFRVGHRVRATVGMAIGVVLHFALDVLQDHHGNGYYLLFPLNVERYELAWIGSESTTTAALPLLGLTLAVAGARGWRERRLKARSPTG